MVTIWNDARRLCGIRFTKLIWWPEPDRRYYYKYKEGTRFRLRTHIPESIAAMVRISLLQPNSGLAMRSFAIYSVRSVPTFRYSYNQVTCGSSGNSAMIPPSAVMLPSSSSAER